MVKQSIKHMASFLGLDLTKNLAYDRLTKAIVKKVLTPQSVCVDVGCHKGEILDLMLAQSRQKHYAFEPIPSMYEELQKKYGNTIHLFSYALANEAGKTTFNVVKNAPAYSGLKQRNYDGKTPDIEQIEVELKRLDDIIPKEEKIDLIKIDVEGAEMGVLKGAETLIQTHQPCVIFECGLGASDYYNTQPEDIFDFFQNAHMHIFLLKSWINKKPYLQKAEFVNIFNENKEYYFLATK